MKKKIRKVKRKYVPPQIKKLNTANVGHTFGFKIQEPAPSVPGPAQHSPSVPGRIIF